MNTSDIADGRVELKTSNAEIKPPQHWRHFNSPSLPRSIFTPQTGPWTILFFGYWEAKEKEEKRLNRHSPTMGPAQLIIQQNASTTVRNKLIVMKSQRKTMPHIGIRDMDNLLPMETLNIK